MGGHVLPVGDVDLLVTAVEASRAESARREVGRGGPRTRGVQRLRAVPPVILVDITVVAAQA
jgi:hypothetical protein